MRGQMESVRETAMREGKTVQSKLAETEQKLATVLSERESERVSFELPHA